MDKYSDYVEQHVSSKASFGGKAPFTLPSKLYGKLGKEGIKKYGNGKEFEDIIDSLWDHELTRSDIFSIFRNENNLYKGFIAAMLWGGLGSDKSRDNLRNAFSYPKVEIEKKLKDVSQKLKANRIADAFESMLPKKPNKISGIGISFFTKLLYFLWPEENKQTIKPLIYDKWSWHIHAALIIDEKGVDAAMDYFIISASLTHKDVYGLIPEITLKDRNNVSVAAYMEYIELLSQKSQGNSGGLEEFLFGQSMKVNKRPDNPRIVLLTCLSGQIDKWIKQTNFDFSATISEDTVEGAFVADDNKVIPIPVGSYPPGKKNEYDGIGHRIGNYFFFLGHKTKLQYCELKAGKGTNINDFPRIKELKEAGFNKIGTDYIYYPFPNDTSDEVRKGFYNRVLSMIF